MNTDRIQTVQCVVEQAQPFPMSLKELSKDTGIPQPTLQYTLEQGGGIPNIKLIRVPRPHGGGPRMVRGVEWNPEPQLVS